MAQPLGPRAVLPRGGGGQSVAAAVAHRELTCAAAAAPPVRGRPHRGGARAACRRGGEHGRHPPEGAASPHHDAADGRPARIARVQRRLPTRLASDDHTEAPIVKVMRPQQAHNPLAMLRGARRKCGCAIGPDGLVAGALRFGRKEFSHVSFFSQSDTVT